MFVINLKGGMGNQMFQYAFGKNLSLKYDLPFSLDLTFLKRRDLGADFVYRNYDLDLFTIDENFFEGGNKTKSIIEPHFEFSAEIINQISKEVKRKSLFKKPGLFIDGYWQTPLYFKENENTIRKDFNFKDPVEQTKDQKIIDMFNHINSSNSVMLNVRRADYLNTDFHGVLGLNFIKQGCEIINSTVTNPTYFLFSDDVEWCRENIKMDNLIIVDHYFKGTKFGYYLQLMRACKHFVVPNSTFAWWAAWLNPDPNKIVIAPKEWFADSTINTKDLIPENWQRI